MRKRSRKQDRYMAPFFGTDLPLPIERPRSPVLAVARLKKNQAQNGPRNEAPMRHRFLREGCRYCTVRVCTASRLSHNIGGGKRVDKSQWSPKEALGGS